MVRLSPIILCINLPPGKARLPSSAAVINASEQRSLERTTRNEEKEVIEETSKVVKKVKKANKRFFFK